MVPKVTTYERVAIYKPRKGTYGYTKEGMRVLRILTAAMAAGHTVSMKEYWDGDQKFFDGEIIWDAHHV